MDMTSRSKLGPDPAYGTMSDRMNKIYGDLAKQERTKQLVRKRPKIGESIPHEGTGFGAVISF